MATSNWTYGIPHYDDTKSGDFWLKSSDGITFRVSKGGLSKVSGFFRDMFGIQQPSDSSEGTEATPLPISEVANTLDILFTFALSSNGSGWEIVCFAPHEFALVIADICGDAIIAAEKYQFEPTIAQDIIYSLVASDSISKQCPAAVYGLAIKYGKHPAIQLASRAMMDSPFAQMSLGRHASTLPISAFRLTMGLQSDQIQNAYALISELEIEPCECNYPAGAEWAELLSARVKIGIEARPSGGDILTLGMLDTVLSTVKCPSCPAHLARNLGMLDEIRLQCLY